MALRVASLAMLLVTTAISSSLAAEALPGESCADVSPGTFRQSSGPEVPGAGHMLVCDGTNWQPVLSYNDDGEITTIGNQSCGNGDVLTYNSTIWTCGAGGGGSGLFERSGTVVRPNSATVTLSTDDFVFGSQSLDDVAGTDDDNRMFFDKSKGAFRVGNGGGVFMGATTLWDNANVGDYSMAWGRGANYNGANRASGLSATAWGGGTAATGAYSTAWGGYGSSSNTNNPIASGQASTAWGHSSLASGFASTAWGGTDPGMTTASGGQSTAWGIGSHASSYVETSLGQYPLNTAGNATSWVATDTLFEIGNGTADNARANAVTVLKNGNFVVGSHSLDDISGTADNSRMYFDKSKGAFRAGHASNSRWDASTANVGINSVAFGRGAIASGRGSMAFGGDAHDDVTITASGDSSLAFGVGNDSDSFITASGMASFAAGVVNYGESIIASGTASYARGVENIAATGESSTAWGGGFNGTLTASGDGSTAWGGGSTASGRLATAWGMGSHAGSYAETSLGRYPLNTAGNATSWVATDTLFEIGIGTNNANRANALTVLKNGNVGIGTAEPQSALHIPNGKFLQAANRRHGGPLAGDCGNDDKFGRLLFDTANYQLHVCLGSLGWYKAALTPSPVMP